MASPHQPGSEVSPKDRQDDRKVELRPATTASRQKPRIMRKPTALPIALVLTWSLAACRPPGEEPAVEVFEALVEGQALDRRDGLERYAPDARAAALESLIEEVRYWGRGPDEQDRLEQLVQRHGDTEAGRIALYRDLLDFRAEVAVFTETHWLPGLRDLAFDGDSATAYRVGENPGGEFREKVRFVRIGATWYLDASR